jgi:DNA-binding response OmpR family regulator
MRVLVVDDEPAIRSLLAAALEDDGFVVFEAPSGMEASKLMEDPDHVDLVVTDLNMTDGVNVAICARTFSPDVPVLFIGTHADQLAALPIPRPCGVLREPFGLEEFSKAVGRLIDPP